MLVILVLFGYYPVESALYISNSYINGFSAKLADFYFSIFLKASSEPANNFSLSSNISICVCKPK